MSMIGQVNVKKGQYKIRGDFHHLELGQPIRLAEENWRLIGITNPRQLTHLHSYGGESHFFENLSKGKLMATRCDNPKCETKGSIYQPFRIHCPDCLGKNTIIDMTDLAKKTAKVHTFMVCERSGAFNILNKPIKFINIEFDGICTILMSYLALGDPKIGMRVVPIFQKLDPTFTILDMAWVPEGTKENQLPKGFAFEQGRAICTNIGIVDRVVPDDLLMAEVYVLASTIAGVAPLAVQRAKDCILATPAMDIVAGLEREGRIFAFLCGTQDKNEAMGAFLEKRTPTFKGR